MLQSFRGSPASPGNPPAYPSSMSVAASGNSGAGAGEGGLKVIEAKYPALLFKQQLTAYVEKIYGMIRDNLKKDISPLLAQCIQVRSVVK